MNPITSYAGWFSMVVTCFWFSNSSAAQLVIDQEVEVFDSADPTGALGGPNIDEFQFAFQTFTVGLGGTLAAIDVQAQYGPFDDPIDDLLLTVHNTLPSGEPDRTRDLGSVSLPASTIPAFSNYTSAPFVQFDVSGLGISVSPGDVLAFKISTATGLNAPYLVFDSQSDVYAGGQQFLFGAGDGQFFGVPRDLGFRTTVNIPEPSSLALIAISGLLIVVRPSNKKY